MLRKLWYHLSKRRKNQCKLLLILMLLASFAEVVSIGAIVPFLAVLTNPEQAYQYQMIQPLIQVLKLTEASQLVYPLTIVFIMAVLFSGIVRLTLLYVMTRISYATGADLSINIYRRTLYQEYEVHLARNSSEVINGITTKTNTVINGVLTPALTLISSIVILVGIIAVLFTIDVKVALIASIGFGMLYLAVSFYTRLRINKNSQIIATQSTQLIKSLQEGLGGIRDVLIDGTQQFYCNIYRNADLPMREALGSNTFITASPRYVVEAIGMVLITGLAYIMTQYDRDFSTVIPVLGALALGAQRLIPALQEAYRSYTTIKASKSSFQDVLYLLDQPQPESYNYTSDDKTFFKKSIQLNNISFRYTPDSPWILKNINLKLNKGKCIGFIGPTGSGKSTLLDLIMGLLTPTNGNIIIDSKILTIKNKKEWQANIAHVPQNIYLSDATIEENIAFGIPKEKIDHKLVEYSAEQAQISGMINEWKDGYNTIVGERGVRLSGGQRQRIGIARALYKQSSVLIFDEATSSLDNKTEYAVMRTIENLKSDLTILIIAHRLTTLKKCNQIVQLDNNYELKIRTYMEIKDE